MRRLSALLVICFCWLHPVAVQAHALDPGYLEVMPLSGDEWRVTWRKPQVNGRQMAIDAVLPLNCETPRAPSAVFDGRAFSSAWVTTCPGGISGGLVAIEGLSETRTDVLVRFASAPDAPVQTRRLTPDATAFEIPARQTRIGVLGSYFHLGLDHILEGFDHLLFVFALLLLLRSPRRIVAAITAFTVAHSVSLGAVTFGYLTVPSTAVEIVIALSIVIVATELMRPEDRPAGLTERYPWSVAFIFGLLHGLGFAGALREIGLPMVDIPLALLAFNVGVEAGQLLFIFAILGIGFLAQRAFGSVVGSFERGSATRLVATYAIGGLASFWMFERIAGAVT